MKSILISALVALALGGGAGAAPIKLGDLRIENPWARATPKGAGVGVGYLTIENTGAAPDRLTGVTADFAAAQVHETQSSNGVMRMREVTGGVEIAPKASLKLSPGGYHLMFTALKRPLLKGETVKATLTFAHAGAVTVDFPVLGVGALGGMSGKM